MDPILAQWGPFTLSWHGLWLAAGVLVFYLLLVREGKQRGFDRESLSELALWILVAGLAGARLFHVVQEWRVYAAEPLRILAVYEGGLTVNGAVCGAVAAAVLFARRKGVGFWRLADAMVMAAPLAFVVGRVGCTINGDVPGLPTNGSWGLVYTHPHAFLPAAWLGIPTFPAPTVLQLWNLGLFLLLRFLRDRVPADGFLAAIYLGVYGLGRFVTNIWQAGEVAALGLKYIQLMALGLILLGAVLAVYLQFGRPVAPRSHWHDLNREVR
jgi:phosphatidylglycerol:prolipoprotein diacylglycerol transferase